MNQVWCDFVDYCWVWFDVLSLQVGLGLGVLVGVGGVVYGVYQVVFYSYLVVYGGYGMVFLDIMGMVGDFYFYFELVVWFYWMFEVGIVDVDEVDYGVFVGFVVFGQEGQQCCGLGQCFDYQYVWYYWFVWEVVVEEFFIYGYVFDCGDGFVVFLVQYVINQQQWIMVWQVLFDLIDVEVIYFFFDFLKVGFGLFVFVLMF